MRARDRAHEPRKDAEASRERECEGKEAGCAARLRERHRVREVREEQRNEADREHRQRPTKHERSPAPTRRETCEREENDRDDGDRPRPGEDLRSEAVARRRADVEIGLVVDDRALQLGGVRRDGRRVPDDRDEPEHEQDGRQRQRTECGEPGAEVGTGPERSYGEESDERDPEEDRVRRVDHGKREPSRGNGEVTRNRRRP